MDRERKRCSVWTARRVDAGVGRLRVLVVDDNANAADALAAYLQFEDYDLETVYGGRQAIDINVTWRPHLIVMDISMPGCNGFEAALSIRKDARGGECAIIAFTALDETEVQRHLVDHEFDAYCQKGQPASQLLALLNHFTT